MKKQVHSFTNVKEFARRGVLITRAGKINTPVFMPVGTRGAVKGLTPEQVKQTGSQIILGNTYHLLLQPGVKTISKLGGLHKFANWKGPILTDSGGFQVFSLAQHCKITEEGVTFKDPTNGNTIFMTPENAIQAQVNLGADVIMAFDDVASLEDSSEKRISEAVERTHRWLERCIKEFQRLTKNIPDSERPLLFGIAQGGLNKNLRRKSLEFIQSQSVDGVAIGGLSVGESRIEMRNMLDFLAPLYDPLRPHYLMGVGDPVDFRFAIERGIDMVDCVLATRNARHGTAWVTGDRVIHLTNAKFSEDVTVLDKSCDCYTCMSGYSKGFLRHQFKVGESLAGTLVSIHNIRYLHRISEEYR